MTRRLPLFALAAALLAPAAAVHAAERSVTLDVENMTCPSCPLIVRQALARVTGVQRVEVSYRTRTATVTFDDALTNIAALITATAQAGYPSRLCAGGS
jgi:mercuric ion binding protein